LAGDFFIICILSPEKSVAVRATNFVCGVYGVVDRFEAVIGKAGRTNQAAERSQADKVFRITQKRSSNGSFTVA